MTVSDKIIDVEGLPVHYLETGEENGRALLLLHGGIGDAQANWSQVLPVLAEQYHVFAPDLPGCGQSASVPDMGIERLCHWVRVLLDTLKQTDIVIVGSSIGAILARMFASAEPQYVPAIVLVNGGMIPKFPGLLMTLVRLPLIGDPALRFYERATYTSKMLDRVTYVHDALTDDLRASWHSAIPGFTALMRTMMSPYNLGTQIPPVPTLILWGANDPLMPLAQAERLKQEIPGAVLSPIAECGHLPQLETSDVFVFQVTSFLEGLSRAREPRTPGVGVLHSD